METNTVSETIYRTLFIISGIVMFAIRIYYQRKIRSKRLRTKERGSRLRLIPGAIAAFVAIVFSLEYIFAPGTFEFAYLIEYPTWLRWVGMLMLIIGFGLLWAAHHHLGRSFHSLVVLKEDQVLVESGPYKRIRHPIYTAYVINYIGGGFLAGNWVLTFVPVFFLDYWYFYALAKRRQCWLQSSAIIIVIIRKGPVDSCRKYEKSHDQVSPEGEGLTIPYEIIEDDKNISYCLSAAAIL